MKKRNILLSTCFATLLGVGVFAGVAANKDAVVKTEAASTTRYYLDCKSHADYDKEQSVAFNYKNSDETWHLVEATQMADNYWYVDVDNSSMVEFQFARCDKGNTDNTYNWQNKSYDKNQNYYEVTDWDNSGTWSTKNVLESSEVASTTPSESTKRVWVDPKDSFYNDGARAALRTFDGSGHLKTYLLSGSTQHYTVGDDYLFYVDIPVNADCQLIRLCPAFDLIWSYGKNFSTMSGYNTSKVVYQWSVDIENVYSAANPSNPDVTYAKLVLDGYSTCLASSDNGYGAYSEINGNVLSKLDSNEVTELRDATFSASGYGTKTYGEKIDRMASHTSSNSALLVAGQEGGNSSNLFMIVASVIAVVAVGGFFLLKKKSSVR